MENFYSVLITAITILGGGAAFRYYEKRAQKRERDDEFIRHDCKDRITKLEALLSQASREKDEMRQMILDLTRQVAELRITVEFLREENAYLEKKTKVIKKPQQQ
jgi:hypothetical protein